LAETFSRLRRGHDLRSGEKVLVVLDQFEQWLHARRARRGAELVEALRQCDGRRVQCLLLVRDDFWMAAYRLTDDLEVPLVKGHNWAAVDLFDERHACKVLAAFGRAYGALADGPPTPEQEAFLTGAVADLAEGGLIIPGLHVLGHPGRPRVADLAEGGLIIPVRLALFAEMVKGRPWAPATLKAVGGAEGVGLAFLEGTFGAPTAPPDHRFHEKAARAVLGALLPDHGADLKGYLRSRDELLEASGYAGRPREFEALLRILDGELRLVTPTDPEGLSSDKPGPAVDEAQYYQLSHDYLVPAVRQWLTRKQQETARGRAALRLAERTALWKIRPEARQLPSWGEWASIRLLTRGKDWTDPQSRMMRAADWYYAIRASVAFTFLGLVAGGGFYLDRRTVTSALVRELCEAEVKDVPPRAERLKGLRFWAVSLLEREAADDHRPVGGGLDWSLQQRNACMALALLEPERLSDLQVDELTRWILKADRADEFAVCASLLGRLETYHGERMAANLSEVLTHGPVGLDQEAAARQRANAAAVLIRWRRGAASAWDVLSPEPNPQTRTLLIHCLKPLGADAAILVDDLLSSDRPALARPALALSLGEYADVQEIGDRKRLVEELCRCYGDDPDPGLHSAVEWLGRTWARRGDRSLRSRLEGIDQRYATGKPEAGRRWYLTRNEPHHTLAVIAEPARRPNGQGHLVPAGANPSPVAIATKEVTVKQFEQFLKARGRLQKAKDLFKQATNPAEDCPVLNVTWFEAVEYCNWLSEVEGIPEREWCYPKEVGPGMELAKDYLARKGYRLPTRAEWERACWAGATTKYFFGDGPGLLGEYAWFSGNSGPPGGKAARSVGQKKPNDLGLFDVYGNASEWCQSVYEDPLLQPAPRTFRVMIDSTCVRKGGGYNNDEEYLSWGRAVTFSPGDRGTNVGLRVARTLP
jgi:hypothetical protein